MTSIAAALVPILALIILGYALKRSGFLHEAAWSGIEKLTYFILFPALLIRSLGSQTIGTAPWHAMLLVVFGTLMAASLALVIWHQFRPTESGATFTSIFQGGVRFNSYITLALAQGFYGPEGLALGSIVVGFMVILINLLCIGAFAFWGTAASRGLRALIKEVFLNPLILSCGLGWFLSASGIGLPGVTKAVFSIIGGAALPLGLMAVGAALKPEAMHGHLGPITISSLVQFGLKPFAALGFIALTGLHNVPAHALLIAFMTPTAASAYILARQLGGDTETMASILVAQTVLAFLIMPTLARAFLV